MASGNGPEWDIVKSDEQELWWSKNSKGGEVGVKLPSDVNPCLFEYQLFAFSILLSIAEQTPEYQETETISLRSAYSGHTSELALPRPLPSTAELSIELFLHVDSLICAGATVPDCKAGRLLGRIEAAAVERFAGIGKKFSDSGRAFRASQNKAKAEKREALRIATEERIAAIMDEHDLKKSDAVRRIAREDGITPRAIWKRLK